MTETARMADVVLPVQAYTEREGTFTSGERRIQRQFRHAEDAVHGSADFVAHVGEELGLVKA